MRSVVPDQTARTVQNCRHSTARSAINDSMWRSDATPTTTPPKTTQSGGTPTDTPPASNHHVRVATPGHRLPVRLDPLPRGVRRGQQKTWPSRSHRLISVDYSATWEQHRKPAGHLAVRVRHATGARRHDELESIFCFGFGRFNRLGVSQGTRQPCRDVLRWRRRSLVVFLGEAASPGGPARGCSMSTV